MDCSYELVVVLDPELETEEQEKLLSKIEKLVSEAGGRTSESRLLGKKELAYPIAKKRTATFWVRQLNLSSEKVANFKQKLQLEEKILRFLMVADKRR